MIYIIIFAVIGSIVHNSILKIINKFDKMNLIFEKKYILTICLSTTVLYYKFELTIDFIFLFYLFIFLITSAYIDQKTFNVYSFLNYLTIIISIIYFVIKFKQIDAENIIIYVALFLLLSLVLTKLKLYGGGDNEVFIAISLFIGIIYQQRTLEILLLDMILANMILILTNIKKFKIVKCKFKDKVAYVPSIALSTIILVLASTT